MPKVTVIRKPSVSHFNLITKEWVRVKCETTWQAKARYIELSKFHRTDHLHVDYGQVRVG